MWRLPLPDVCCASELFWLLPRAGDWWLQCWGMPQPYLGRGWALTHPGEGKSHLWFQGADLSARTGRREAPQRWGSSSGGFGFHGGDSLLVKYIWKRNFLPPHPFLAHENILCLTPGHLLRFQKPSRAEMHCWGFFRTIQDLCGANESSVCWMGLKKSHLLSA